MNLPRDREHDLERLLDEGSGELGSLYRRLPRIEPPRRLDRNVLGQAARAVRGKAPQRHRWLVGFGSAAGVVLAAGIAWQIGQEVLHQQSTRSAPQMIPVQPITEPAQRKKREHAADAYPEIVMPQDAAPAAAPEPLPPAAKPTPPRAAAPKPHVVTPTVNKVPAAATPAPPPVPAPFAAETETRSPAPASAGAAAAVAPEAFESKASNADESDRVAAPRARSAAPPSPSTSVELRRDMQLAPQDWLAHIQQLLRQGRRQQAIESLRLFRRSHPDWQLSAELEALSQ